ncbi:MAG: 30S ribosomal protein S9 [Patescibacteria group bacterium]
MHHDESEAKKGKKLPYLYSVGKRKTAVARVRFYPKDERTDFIVDGVDYKTRFPYSEYQLIVEQTLKKVDMLGKYFITVKLAGGGIKSQAEAVRHGLARVILKFDETLRKTLKGDGLLTRDSRKKERKKPGLKRARRAPQFAKR